MVPLETFITFWMTSGITSNNYPTIFTMFIQLRYTLWGTGVANFNQLIISFPTLDQPWGNNMFPFDFGTGYTNGQFVDCYSPGNVFDCKLSTGGNTLSQPASLIITSPNTIVAGGGCTMATCPSFFLFIPNIKTPPNVQIYSTALIYIKLYNSGT
jgi:hypothetical protein